MLLLETRVWIIVETVDIHLSNLVYIYSSGSRGEVCTLLGLLNTLHS